MKAPANLSRGHDDSHGRSAQRPSEIPKAGWWDIAKRVWAAISRYEISMVSAGIAFNEFFALFPALAAGVALYGLVADPATVDRQLGILAGFLPADVHSLIAGQLEGLVHASQKSLGVSLILAVAIALWGATRGVKGLMSGLDIVYQETEKRGFVRYNLTALALTFGAIVFGLFALTLVAAVPPLLKLLPVGEGLQSLLSALRWPLLAGFVLVGLAVIYRYGPARDTAQWRWVSWGAVLATLLWLIGSGLFSLYAARFGDFNKTYGSMAAVAVTLLWFQLTSFVVLLGGLINAEMEHQTARDTTEGPAQPMGRRGATMADTLGSSSADQPPRRQR